jgi:hypothetical protein
MKVQCCFCAESMNDSDAAQIVIYPDSCRETNQSVYAHRKCVLEVVFAKMHAGVPAHPALEN